MACPTPAPIRLTHAALFLVNVLAFPFVVNLLRFPLYDKNKNTMRLGAFFNFFSPPIVKQYLVCMLPWIFFA